MAFGSFMKEVMASEKAELDHFIETYKKLPNMKVNLIEVEKDLLVVVSRGIWMVNESSTKLNFHLQQPFLSCCWKANFNHCHAAAAAAFKVMVQHSLRLVDVMAAYLWILNEVEVEAPWQQDRKWFPAWFFLVYSSFVQAIFHLSASIKEYRKGKEEAGRMWRRVVV
jgi:hypothetical protein